MSILDAIKKDCSDIKKISYAYNYLNSIDEGRAKHLLGAVDGYAERDYIGAFRDLVNISYGYNDCGASWSKTEAAIIILLWECKNNSKFERWEFKR